MAEKYRRRSGKRIKQWGWEGDIDRLIEATGECPLIDQALGQPTANECYQRWLTTQAERHEMYGMYWTSASA